MTLADRFAHAQVRPLAEEHLPALQQVQRACYGEGYIESTEVFARRLACTAQCSLVLELDGRVAGYLAACDVVQGWVAPLHGDFEALTPPDTLYLHDLAVLPELSGHGLAQRLLQTLWQGAQARGLQRSALVSVQGTQGFWQRQGYLAWTLQDPVQRERLVTYGRDAVYMQRRLG
ncbi:MAG: GNAT family N-acetyltransferase [Burkholderiales bacterium 68-12]|uniref:GNAT family N-acetyltransferase n=1 Tax=Comamonas granuli TaxID=290309 RepID=UPI0005A7F15C|nr:GNAT family N-acetyltransferase [Comamonas granuli]OJX34429.1 MAG: GNAT family N-acetyltransferase [Burkholderiales bacterium 68-12]